MQFYLLDVIIILESVPLKSVYLSFHRQSLVSPSAHLNMGNIIIIISIFFSHIFNYKRQARMPAICMLRHARYQTDRQTDGQMPFFAIKFCSNLPLVPSSCKVQCRAVGFPGVELWAIRGIEKLDCIQGQKENISCEEDSALKCDLHLLFSFVFSPPSFL